MRTTPILALISLLALDEGQAASGSQKSEATTAATAFGGHFEIRGITGHARHTHGGAPALLGYARFAFANRGDRPRKVAVGDIEFLSGSHDCENPPRRVVSHLKAGGILMEDGKQRESALQVELKPGSSVEAVVGFTTVPAYYVYCDRFAFRVHFRVDGAPVVVTDEVLVTRMEPLREE